MNERAKSVLVIALIVVGVLILLFGGGLATGTMMGGGMMGNGMMGGISWMWVPTLLTVGVGLLIGWTIWGKKV